MHGKPRFGQDLPLTPDWDLFQGTGAWFKFGSDPECKMAKTLKWQTMKVVAHGIVIVYGSWFQNTAQEDFRLSLCMVHIQIS